MSTPLSFNASWYLSQNPDVAAAIEAGAPFNAFEHFTLYGRAENRSASPVFDAQEYLRNNPDVAEAVAQGLITAWDHFELFGGAEGRSPTPLFNEAFYLQQNPDVAAAIEQGIISSAAQHFALFGHSEPRAINPAINLGQYINANPDIGQAAANGLVNVFDHLLQYGVNEGRDLGNGVSLRDFASDPGFTQALGGGKPVQALIRVETVAPFLPTFERPAGWTPRENTPIPVDFVPPADSGIKLVVPPEVVVPDDVELPEDVFEPVEPVTPPAPTPGGGGGDGDTNPIFMVTESEDGVLSFGGSATGDITLSVDNDGVATFARDGIAAATTVILSEAELVKINLAESQQLLASGPQLDGLNIHFVGQGKVNIRDVQLTQATTAIVDGVMVARPASSNTNLAQIILPVSDDSADISINGSVGDLIKLSWIYFDQKYYEEFEETFPESYYDLPLTLAKAELSLKYIDYLKNNEPFTDFTAKTAVASGVQTRDQSIHDNLLGELTQGALNDRLGGPDRTDELAYYTEAAGEFFYRPYNSGTTPGSNDSLAASVIWDLDHGIGRGESVEDGNVFVISKSSSTATLKDGVQDAINDAGNGDIVYVGPGTFSGDIDIDKNGVNIVLSSQAILDGGFVVRSGVKGFNLSGDGTILNGLSGEIVAGSAGKGIYLQSDAHVTVEGITFEVMGPAAGQFRGIEAEGGDSVINVTDATFDGAWQTGIYLNPGNSLEVTGSEFVGGLVGVGTDGPAKLVVNGSRFDTTWEGIGLTANKVIGKVDISGNSYADELTAIANGGKDTGLTELVGEYVVVVAAGQDVQNAVDAFYVFADLNPGDETGQIVLGIGDFTGDVKINGNLKLLGQGAEDSTVIGSIRINDPSDAGKTVSNIWLEGFTVDPEKAGVTPIIALSNHDGFYNTENLSITNVTIVTDKQHGLGLFDVEGATLSNLHIVLEDGGVGPFYAIEALGLKDALLEFITMSGGFAADSSHGALNVWWTNGYENSENIKLTGVDGADNQTIGFWPVPEA